MAFLKKVPGLILHGAAGGLLGLGLKLFGGGSKKPAAQLPTATRDDAVTAIERDDALRRRQGSAADMLTGIRGAEAAGTTGHFILGS